VIVEDAATLKSGDKTIRLAGVSPAAADKTCTDEAGQTWPCGRVAAAALRMLIRHRAIDCTVVSEFDDEIVGNCSAGLQDINGWLVEQGWAEADPGAGYGEEADAARAEKRGIYLAKWEVKGKGGSGVVPQSSFTAPALPSQPYSSIPAAEPAPSGEATVQGPAN
jgi:endonuclease YncB( thermonuclease family)